MVTQPDGWADASPNGVPVPTAPAGLPPSEAESPARRSPQVRAAQRTGNRRPDLLDRQAADTP